MVNNAQSDAEVMKRVADGDTQAFASLVKQHLPRAYALAYRTLMNAAEAEDIAQEAFTKLWVKARDYDASRAAFATWLHRIVVNLCLDRIRQRKPHGGSDEIAEIADDRPSAESLASDHEEADLVREAVAALPEQQRLAVSLCYFEEYTNPEAAKLMGLHIKALEGLLVRARKTLREKLGELKEVRHVA
ncbi:MAG: RNA polymerase sigma factor [Rickettsiales bacterium]